MAVDAGGNIVTWASPAALAYCLLAALFKAAKTTGGLKHPDALTRTLGALARAANIRPSFGALWQWNDVRGRTHGEVLALIARASTY